MAEHRSHRRRAWAAAGALVLAAVLALAYWSHSRHRIDVPLAVPPERTAGATVSVWISTADRREQLARQPDVPLAAAPPAATDIVIDRAQRFQSIVGFGAALTDSSAWLLENRLGVRQRDALLRELFGPPPGLNFRMLRVTIGASDFSLQHYSLDDLPPGQTDPSLAHFNITADAATVIPALHAILGVAPDLRILASPWSAPAWMKTSANLISGTLFEQYESTYADYLVRYLDAMRGAGIPIWALTVQNEPTFQPLTYPGMELPAAARARIIGQYLGPALAGREPRTRILGWDDNWNAPDEPLGVLADPDAEPYVDGIAWHCYRGHAGTQSEVHDAFPDKEMFLTECSGGDWPSSRKGELMLFAHSILMASLKNWASGAIYWNLALDERYGPHAGGCATCKGVVTIDTRADRMETALKAASARLATAASTAATDRGVDAALRLTGDLLDRAVVAATPDAKITRNDYYYAFGHYSRFVLPGAVRVGSSAAADGIDNVAFQNRADGTLVLVVVNGNARPHRITVRQGDAGFAYELPAQSVATFTWPPAAGATPLPPAAAAPAQVPLAPVPYALPAGTTSVVAPAIAVSSPAPAFRALPVVRRRR